MSVGNDVEGSEYYVVAALSDTVDLVDGICRGLILGTDGAVKVTRTDGTAVVIPFLASGIAHSIKARRIWSTGTTATGIIALY